MDIPHTKYAMFGDAQIAYQVFGEGPIDVVYCQGTVGGSIDAFWDHPVPARFFERLGTFSRVVLFNARGGGASDRLPADRPPTWEDWAEDFRVVLDAVDSEQAALLVDGGSAHIGILFAAHHPDRTSALILFNATAKWLAGDDYPGIPAEAEEEYVRIIERMWSTEDFVALSVPSMAGDRGFLRWGAKTNRAGLTPQIAAARARLMWTFDLRSVLPTVSVPTLVLHRKDCPQPPIEHGRYLADHIPGAGLVELPGADAAFFTEGAEEILAVIEEFLTGTRRAREPDRVLATVLFTDVVSSTERVAQIGDRRWKELLDRLDRVVHGEIEKVGGRLVNTAGDGHLATFDGPGKAIRCALSLVEGVSSLGIQIRAGLHTGEVERRGSDVGGIAVHIGARVASLAGASEVLVSRTVVDLVVGSGIEFDDRGTCELKGVPGEWRLFAVRS